MCGGAVPSVVMPMGAVGLSPRVRGSPHGKDSSRCWGRSIPACAGEPANNGQVRVMVEVYPRVCGGAFADVDPTAGAVGLSPRVRGSPAGPYPTWSSRRSIPACAGEPVQHPPAHQHHQVYPRVCGGAWNRPIIGTKDSGLSPRVRGSPTAEQFYTGEYRSIPACAGEPFVGLLRRKRERVYPRVCGGASRPGGGVSCGPGLSPRVRGSPTLRPWRPCR